MTKREGKVLTLSKIQEKRVSSNCKRSKKKKKPLGPALFLREGFWAEIEQC